MLRRAVCLPFAFHLIYLTTLTPMREAMWVQTPARTPSPTPSKVLKTKPNILEFRIYERSSEQLFKEVIDTLNLNVKAAKVCGCGMSLVLCCVLGREGGDALCC